MYSELLNACVFGNGPELVSSVPMIRKQGNGNFTGLMRSTYSNGEVVDSVFVMNARSHKEVMTDYVNKREKEDR